MVAAQLASCMTNCFACATAVCAVDADDMIIAAPLHECPAYTVLRVQDSSMIFAFVLRAGQVRSTSKPLNLKLLRGPGASREAAAAADRAASAEASANADPQNVAAYHRSESAVHAADQQLVAQVTVASAAMLPQVA